MNDVKNILITGGAGFIGSHLVKHYLDRGHRVFCLDNLQTTGTIVNLRDVERHRNFTILKHDIIEPISIAAPLDWVFNLACSGSHTSYQFDPVHTIRTNTVGVFNVLELAESKRARVLQASTSEIYGDPAVHPQTEDYTGNVNVLGPRACYDEGKRVAETIAAEFHRERGLDIRIARIFNTYGPRMSIADGRAMSGFVVSALAGRDLEIYGDGKQTRSFQYIDDLVEGIDRLMSFESRELAVVNLGRPEEITMNDLAALVISRAGSTSGVTHTRAATDDPRRRCPDITRARSLLGWEPNISLEVGLLRTIAYFKSIAPETGSALEAHAKHHKLARPK